jgi:hypothetical protein
VGTEVIDLFRLVARRHATDQAVKEAALTLGLAPMIEPPTDALEPGTPEARAGAAIEALLGEAQRAGAIRDDVGIVDLWALVVGTPASDETRERYLDIVIAGLRPPDR